MKVNLEELEEFDLNPPKKGSQLTKAEKHFGCQFPMQYRDFMAKHDGGEGFIGEDYVELWRAGELVEYNQGYEEKGQLPELVLFGSNGADEGFAFDTRKGSMKILMVPLTSMNFEDAIPLGDTFEDFLCRVAKGLFE